MLLASYAMMVLYMGYEFKVHDSVVTSSMGSCVRLRGPSPGSTTS